MAHLAAGLFEIIEDPVIKNKIDLLQKMTLAEDTVDLFDDSTWDREDYEPLVDVTHKPIVIHAIYQHRAENHIQLAALVARTNVQEDRRT